jgi:hypothetical protein
MLSSDQPEKDIPLTIAAEVEEPSYEACLGWMKELADERAITLDFWSRGNFVRRMLCHRNAGVEPLLVPASSPDQMRWAFRRLALLGVPVEFVYTGPMSEPRWVKHWHPLDIPIDSGWGYIVFAGTVVKSPSDRLWWPVLGFASLMPPSIPSWLAEEVPNSFLAGRVLVAPAELIGISPRGPMPEIDALAEVVRGVPTSQSADAATAILDLELPWIDGMSPGDFETLLADHEDELAEFHAAFRSLMAGNDGSLSSVRDAQERFRSAVTELHQSRRLAQFRAVVAKCKGSLASFPIAMGVLAAAGSVYAQDPFAGAAVIGAAGKALRELWTQARTEAQAATRSPLRLLFSLGVEKARFQSRRQSVRFSPVPLLQPTELTPCHWLCPPSGAGLRVAMPKEE